MISRQNYKSAWFQWSKLLPVLRWQKNRGYVQENCCSSATKLCAALCNPTDCSTPCSSVLRYLPEFAQTHVHRFGDVNEPSHPLPPPSPIFIQCLQSFPASGSFPMSWLFASDGQSIGASASIIPMNIQGWFPLELTGLISLQPKELSRVFSSTTIWKHQFFGTHSSLWTNSHKRIIWWLIMKFMIGLKSGKIWGNEG